MGKGLEGEIEIIVKEGKGKKKESKPETKPETTTVDSGSDAGDTEDIAE
jgi:hypothetical protein